MTTRVNFEHELENLKKSVENMGLEVETSIDNLFEAVKFMDEEMVRELVRGDRKINDMERNIEAQCLSLITRQQPIAGDLRLVSTALKAVTDLERIGDHAVDIAELLLRNREDEFSGHSKHIAPMIEASKQMVHEAVDAFANRNTETAAQVIESDDIVDELFNKVKNDVILSLREESGNADICVDLLMIAKYLEKIGDHAVNIAEWEIFRETGLIRNVRLL